MVVLSYCFLLMVEVVAGFYNEEPDNPEIICNYSYKKLHYSELPIHLLTPQHYTSTSLSIQHQRDTLLDQRKHRTILGEYFPLELSSLQFAIHRISNLSALLFITCNSIVPGNLHYYNAFLIHKPLILDSKPHWYWIQRVSDTSSPSNPAFPDQWKRVQLASNANFSHLRLHVCQDSVLYLDVASEDPNAFGCRSTDTHGLLRQTDRSLLEKNGLRIAIVLEDAKRAKRFSLTYILASIYGLVGVVSCLAFVWLFVRLGRSSEQMQTGTEDQDVSPNRPASGDPAPVVSGARIVMVRRNTAPAQFISTHI